MKTRILKIILLSCICVPFQICLIRGIAFYLSRYEVLREIPVDANKLECYDFRIFQGTDAWTIAKAVEDEDTVEIYNQARKNRLLVYSKEMIHGGSLLDKACYKGKTKSVEALLKLGVNPNQNRIDGFTPLHSACSSRKDVDKIVNLLLKYGADPNKQQQPTSEYIENDIYIDDSYPLYLAVKLGKLKVVKSLVNAGANIDIKNQRFSFGNLVNESLVQENYDITLYLLNLGADYKTIFTDLSGKKNTPVDFLRRDVYPLGSKRYKEKMQLVAWFKAHGMDYYAVPISERTKRDIKHLHPDSVDIYLKLY